MSFRFTLTPGLYSPDESECIVLDYLFELLNQYSVSKTRLVSAIAGSFVLIEFVEAEGILDLCLASAYYYRG